MFHLALRVSIASIRPFCLNVAIRHDKRRKRSTNGINKLTGINREYVTNREYTSQVVHSNDKNLSICELIVLNRYKHSIQFITVINNIKVDLD